MRLRDYKNTRFWNFKTAKNGFFMGYNICTLFYSKVVKNSISVIYISQLLKHILLLLIGKVDYHHWVWTGSSKNSEYKCCNKLFVSLITIRNCFPPEKSKQTAITQK